MCLFLSLALSNGKKIYLSFLSVSICYNKHPLSTNYISISYIHPISVAQFGINKEVPNNPSNTNDEEPKGENEKVTTLTEQDAINIGAVIKAAGEDPETIKMITKLKAENTSELDELRNFSEEEILEALKVAMNEMQMVDYLFQDKERALQEMEKEGMIPQAHLKKYKKDPSLLEEDTRKALYFRFISLATVGGYL